MVVPGLAADNGSMSSVWWLVGVYLIQTWSELLLSPIGLSATTKLAPAAIASQLLALWFLAEAVGDAVGGQAVRLQESIGFAGYFAVMGLAAVAVGVAFVPLVPWVRRLMSGA